MHTETIPPYITLHSLGKSTEYYKVRPGTIKREFLDNTQNSHGYNCGPITDANFNGWEIILPEEVVVIWDGISNTESYHVKILKGKTWKKFIIAETSTANSTISFNINATIETDPNHYLLLSGPPNYFIDGAIPMNALVKTNWYTNTRLQFCWKLTKKNKKIIFPKGMPFVFLQNYPIDLLEKTTFKIKQASLEKEKQLKEYQEKRSILKKNNPFPNLYKKGLDEKLNKISNNKRPIASEVIYE